MRSLALLLTVMISSFSFAQAPVSLRTSDPKFAPGWEVIDPPQYAFYFHQRSPSYTAGVRTPGSYEVAYCLVDEAGAVSPPSTPVTINPTTNDWDIVGTTPGVPLWTRAGGIYWVWRATGTAQWKHFACDENRQHQWLAARPFKAICGWQHTYGGHWLYQTGNFSSFDGGFPASTILVKSPPAPAVRLHECPNSEYELAWSWACNENETALSPTLSIPTTTGPPQQHAPFWVIRQLPAGAAQPPQGALGMYIYMRKAGTTQWHRQPCLDGHTGNLWPLDLVTFRVTNYVETGIEPGPATGKSYLSSLHKALKYWSKDIIIDNDQVIRCPLISEYSGKTWDYQPRNTWVACYGTTSGSGTWTLTIDGVTTPPMVRTNNFGQAWQQWQPTLDATFGVGNIKISDYWVWFAPKIELVGKWSATDMLAKVSIAVKDNAMTAVDSQIVASQAGQGWVMSQADTKFIRTISTSNAGHWTVTDSNTTPDGTTGYPMGWPMWLECSQRTRLVGTSFILTQSNCCFATCDNNGGGCFHPRLTRVSSTVYWANVRPVTFGIRCLGSSSWGIGGHSCSELIADECFLQAKFPIVMEGNQTVNWQVRDTNTYSNGTFDSAIITAANANAIQMGGRTTADNVRALVASVWCKGVYINEIFVDKGIPALVSANANSWTKLSIGSQYGGKINQIINGREQILQALEYEGINAEVAGVFNDQALEALLLFVNVYESPAGPNEPYVMKFVTDNLDNQHNSPVRARMITPKANAIYKPRDPTEVPTMFGSLLP